MNERKREQERETDRQTETERCDWNSFNSIQSKENKKKRAKDRER